MRKFTSLLLLGFAIGSFAQTPGGVSGSELWFKTAPLNSDLQGYYRWQDFSGDSIRLMLLDSRGVKSEHGSHALVTTVTDALHNVQATHTNGSGKTLKTIQKSGPDGEITTSFEYDGIQRLVRVTDTEGNVTTSTYDMGDRRTEVNHPASGITSFTYDALGNVLTKQTANLAKEGT